jgi:hypothetical protein
VLLPLCLVLFLFVLVLPLPIIHGFGHGRLGSRSDKNQIEPQVLRFSNGLGGWKNFYSSVGKNRAHFAGANRFIDVFPDSGTAGWKSSRNHRHIGMGTEGEAIMT